MKECLTLNDDKQKKIFSKTIGGNLDAFSEERLIEEKISEDILGCSPDSRDVVYRQSYEKLHNFFISVSGDQHLYKGTNVQRALWKQRLIGNIVGKGQRILEVGCGEGFLSIALSQRNNKVNGVDVSDTCILLANKNKIRFNSKNVNFSRMSATQLKFQPNTFDWIFSMDLLEHLHPEDALVHLREASSLLKENGKYLLMTPNSKNGAHAGGVHIKEYNLTELQELFNKAGFSIKSPLLNIVSPINLKVNPQIKQKMEKLPQNQITNLIFGLDPIVLIAKKANH